MHVRIVTFRLDGLDHEGLRQQADAVAPAFAELPGLLAKIWLADPATATYGGVYLFATAADAAAALDGDLFRRVAEHPHFVDLTVRDFGVLDGPTARTSPFHRPFAAVGGPGEAALDASSFD